MFTSPEEAIIHTSTVVLAMVVLGIALIAYKRRGGRRYFLLLIAFVFLAFGEVVQFAESFLFNALIYIPVLDFHLSHLLDLAMLVCFGLALSVK
jgi:lipopolysaccharide export LptBFGC system permease protein LptF